MGGMCIYAPSVVPPVLPVIVFLVLLFRPPFVGVLPTSPTFPAEPAVAFVRTEFLQARTADLTPAVLVQPRRVSHHVFIVVQIPSWDLGPSFQRRNFVRVGLAVDPLSSLSFANIDGVACALSFARRFPMSFKPFVVILRLTTGEASKRTWSRSCLVFYFRFRFLLVETWVSTDKKTNTSIESTRGPAPGGLWKCRSSRPRGRSFSNWME